MPQAKSRLADRVQTMAAVIPPLVESLHKRKVDSVISISELLLSFVAAYKDIPLQRRQDIFLSLTNRVGADNYLFALLILLIEKYPGDNNVVEFATKLTAQQDCTTQLTVCSAKNVDNDETLIESRRLRNILKLCSIHKSQSPRCRSIY